MALDKYNDQPINTHSQTANGIVVGQDIVRNEVLEDFITSPTKPRVVHTKGWGAFGTFRPINKNIRKYTKLSFLQNPSEVQVAVRFSLAVSNKGTPDTSRNVRGMATKFYAQDGNFDLLCNHIPVFSVQDAIRFPESIKAFFPSEATGLIDPDRFWGFVARAPEALHFVMWLYSDWGTIKSLRKMRFFGVNTYVWVNNEGEHVFVKYHWIPQSGVEHITGQQAVEIAGEDPDICGHDLYRGINAGGVKYDLNVQIMTYEQAEQYRYDPLDDTKVWGETEYPLIRVGTMTLNKAPNDYTAEVESLAFNPANVLDGVEFSNDKMLQGRTVYSDAQRHRMGNDFKHKNVNTTVRGSANHPHSLGQPLMALKTQWAFDPYSAAEERLGMLNEEEYNRTVFYIANDLQHVSSDIYNSIMNHMANVNSDFAKGISVLVKELKYK